MPDNKSPRMEISSQCNKSRHQFYTAEQLLKGTCSGGSIWKISSHIKLEPGPTFDSDVSYPAPWVRQELVLGTRFSG